MIGTTVLAWATLVGTGLSLAGVAIAIMQIRKTAKAAAAAELAAHQARAAISGNVLLTDLAGCVRSIEEVKALLRASRSDAALLRITDTRALLIQLRTMVVASTSRSKIQRVVTQLAVLRDVLEGVQQGRQQDLDPMEAGRALSDCSDVLTEWLGQAKYLTKDNHHAP